MDGSFFRFCTLNFAKHPQSNRPEDEMIKAPRQAITRTKILPNGDKLEEEIDLLTEFSWRNFFSTINFAKIMQKLSKHRSHRIRMLVQYKSSVSDRCLVLFTVCFNDGGAVIDDHLGGAQTHSQSSTPHVAAACPEANQEPSTFLRTQVETV